MSAQNGAPKARRAGAPPTQRTGAAFHSLRAVPLENLRAATLRLREIDAGMPVHIHVAEQVLEVKACVLQTGRRPIELLLDTGLLDPHWCLVHATHATAKELQGIAAAGAAVCVSISTEANLGDGFFDAARFLKAGGRLCVGSDSQSTVNPAEELRWLEYQQRLRKKRRGVLAGAAEPHVGTRLWRDAAQHGAQAIGQPAGSDRGGPPRRLAGAGCRPSVHGWARLRTPHWTMCCSQAAMRPSAMSWSRAVGSSKTGATRPKTNCGRDSRR